MKYRFRFFLFFAVMILFNLAANFAHRVTPTIIQNLGLPDYMFGLMFAMMMVSNFLFSPFWGKINTAISSRTTLLISCVGYAAAQLGFAYGTGQGVILAARTMAGIFVGGIYVSFLTYVINMAKPEDQGKFLTYSATIQSVFGAFGYLVGGFLGEYSIRVTFLLQVSALALAGVAFYFICLPDNLQTEKVPVKQIIRQSNPLQAFLDGRYFMTMAFCMLFAVNILTNFGNTGFDQVFNYYLKDQLALTSSYNGCCGTDFLCVQYDAVPLDHPENRYGQIYGGHYRGLHGGIPWCAAAAADRNVYCLQCSGLCWLFRQPAGAAAYGGGKGRSGAEKSGDGILQCDQISGQCHRISHGRIPVWPSCEAAFLCGGACLRHQHYDGCVVSDLRKKKRTEPSVCIKF